MEQIKNKPLAGQVPVADLLIWNKRNTGTRKSFTKKKVATNYCHWNIINVTEITRASCLHTQQLLRYMQGCYADLACD